MRFLRSYSLTGLLIVSFISSFSLNAQALDLTKIDPPEGTRFKSGKKALLTFYFDNSFNPFRSRVEMTGSQGAPELLVMVPADDHKALRTQLDLPVGTYKLHWHVQAWNGDKADGIYELHVSP